MENNEKFESQSETIIEHLMRNGMNREVAMKFWYTSKTYHAIIERKLTYISAMRALFELELERKGSMEWMQKSFE